MAKQAPLTTLQISCFKRQLGSDVFSSGQLTLGCELHVISSKYFGEQIMAGKINTHTLISEVLQHKGLVYRQILILKPFTAEGFYIDD